MRFFIAITFIILGFAGCKKEDNQPVTSTYYIQFKADGQWVKFTGQTSVQAAIGQSGIQYTLVVSGFTSNSNASLVFYDNEAINQGIYSGYSITGGFVSGALISYQSANGAIYSTNGANPEIEATISLFTDKEVKGTFNGVVKHTSSAQIIEITEGDFFVKRIN